MADDDEGGGGVPEWMCTFSDMMSLLLCFFVLLVALSSTEKKKMIQAAGSLRAAFGGMPAPYLVENIPDKKTAQEMSRPAQNDRRRFYGHEELRRELDAKVRDWNLQETVQVTGSERGITFRVSGDSLFDPGKSTLKGEAILALGLIAEELIEYPSNPIVIEGNTDDTLRESSNTNANWLLAADRAYTVLRFLTDEGSRWGRVPEKQMTYESHGQFDPVADNRTAIGRYLNRRVDITLIQTDEGDGTYFRSPIEKNPRTPLLAPDAAMVNSEDGEAANGS